MKSSALLQRALWVGALCTLPLFAHAETVIIPLQGFQEVPVVSTTARGTFVANLQNNAIRYELRYDALQGDVLQAHIHLGQRDVNGGVSVFLCQTATNPDLTGLAPVCPPPPARVTGTLTAANVIGPANQGIAAGEFAELLRAIRAGKAYVNVHSSTFPGGEVRGQAGHGH
jgi:hypothetical protein